jgi:cation:H+ antiporter
MIDAITPPIAFAVLLVAAAIVLFAGPRMVAVADRLADVTGLGEAIVGAVLIGSATSLPDLIATVSPALNGLPDLAVGNALGGVLAQTAFLAIADIAYRRANLEHAAASLPNLMQGALLVTLLAAVTVLFHAPEVTIGHVHVGTFLLPAMYLYGMRLVSQAGTAPMWRPTETTETLQDEAEDAPGDDRSLRTLVLTFAGYGALLAGAGFGLAASGEVLVAQTGLSETAVGVVFTGFASSLAELVVGVSAVRRGALTLAVGNVIGGNTFDTLLVGVADVAYREGSVYSAVGSTQSLYTALAILMTGVILMGLLRRERYGVGRIGAESAAVLGLYALGIALVL